MSFRKRIATTLATAALAGAALTAGTGTADATPGASYITQGQNGFQVYCVQVGINWATWSSAHVWPVDGSFGPDTLAQLQQFQHDSGLKADGIVGPDTGDKLWQALQIDISKNNNPQSGYGLPVSSCYDVLPTHG
ncbi:peptidoglycan-binding protein [Kitasatospora sp. NPDC059088]|uniref:peptidoglycan-binding domain-containing protein n=1 Tax=unclassified Kitasatospora TaxID=2633591 RepID=UPI0036948F35